MIFDIRHVVNIWNRKSWSEWRRATFFRFFWADNQCQTRDENQSNWKRQIDQNASKQRSEAALKALQMETTETPVMNHGGSDQMASEHLEHCGN